MFADDTNLFYFINEWILANKVSLKAKKKKRKKKTNKQTKYAPLQLPTMTFNNIEKRNKKWKFYQISRRYHR